MQLIRSLIFNILLYVGLITIFILAIPTLVLPSKFTIFFGRLSAKYIVLILRIILNTRVIFHGVENLKKVDNYFVASAHQSMFETFALQIPLDGPIFILKKELLINQLDKVHEDQNLRIKKVYLHLNLQNHLIDFQKNCLQLA